MKKLLLIMILILSFIGCKDEEAWDTGAPKKGAKFKVYSYEEKLEIARKVGSQEWKSDEIVPQDIYPEISEAHSANLDILRSEHRDGNKKASQELDEWKKAFAEIGYIPIKDSRNNNN